ncbi:hypothetical protein DERF_011428 [Dermatophagoides farinae]|uniref:Uncharacterized protein n=1 Tax=Dermatophagoides farinae TaxID=6954 RepID=A0A922KZG7_DERFA|nr:hypothetical protein DERF_011428 [Dermatophagoides farinae]
MKIKPPFSFTSTTPKHTIFECLILTRNNRLLMVSFDDKDLDNTLKYSPMVYDGGGCSVKLVQQTKIKSSPIVTTIGFNNNNDDQNG